MSRFTVQRVACAGLLAVAGWACATPPGLELRGFRGVPWGAGVDELGPATLASSQGEVSCYRRQHENMLFGDSPLKDIRFCFHHDHLFMVALDAQTDIETLAGEFESTYGPPDARTPQRTAWGDRTSRARVEMVAPTQGGASMFVVSNEYEPSPTQQAKSF